MFNARHNDELSIAIVFDSLQSARVVAEMHSCKWQYTHLAICGIKTSYGVWSRRWPGVSAMPIARARTVSAPRPPRRPACGTLMRLAGSEPSTPFINSDQRTHPCDRGQKADKLVAHSD